MLLLELNSIVQYYGDRLIFRIEDLKVYAQDKIGIVGLNGAGKTTLMDIMAGRLTPDEGRVKTYSNYSYITQLMNEDELGVNRRLAHQFKLAPAYKEYMSGGEKTRYKIAAAFSRNSEILFAEGTGIPSLLFYFHLTLP